MEKYNAIFTLNKNDQTRISKNISSDKTAIVNSPYGLLNIPEIEEDYISNFLPNKIIFLGSEMHAPNADAVKWFIEEIMSEIIIKYPDITFQITGNWSDKTKNRYARNRNVVFVGFIKNIEEFVKNSVMVVPIRIGGGGMRAKVLEGLAYGCPVLSTSLGCEGFENAEGAIRVCDTPEKFIYEIYQIIHQPDAAKLMIRNGKKCIEDFFDFKKLALQRLDFYNDMISE
jgi:glycosyltransferase involved in cell wall biosynthesis